VVELLEPKLPEEQMWILYVDGSSNKKGSGARIVLEGPRGLRVEQTLIFECKPSNNQTEYGSNKVVRKD